MRRGGVSSDFSGMQYGIWLVQVASRLAINEVYGHPTLTNAFGFKPFIKGVTANT